MKDTSPHNGGVPNGVVHAASNTVNQNNDEAAAAAFAISGSANGAQSAVGGEDFLRLLTIAADPDPSPQWTPDDMVKKTFIQVRSKHQLEVSFT